MANCNKIWNEAVLYSKGKGKRSTKEAFILKMDKFFDILNCKYPILTCEIGACITCSCFRKRKPKYST